LFACKNNITEYNVIGSYLIMLAHRHLLTIVLFCVMGSFCMSIDIPCAINRKQMNSHIFVLHPIANGDRKRVEFRPDLNLDLSYKDVLWYMSLTLNLALFHLSASHPPSQPAVRPNSTSAMAPDVAHKKGNHV